MWRTEDGKTAQKFRLHRVVEFQIEFGTIGLRKKVRMVEGLEAAEL